MKRCNKVVIIFALIFVVMLAGCSKSENEVAVYSFSGNNGYIQITNGVIVMSERETVFNGGNLELLKSDYSSIASCSMTFYIMSGKQFIKLSRDKKAYKERKQQIGTAIKEIIEAKFLDLQGKLDCLDVWDTCDLPLLC